jgi:hypothetical protein
MRVSTRVRTAAGVGCILATMVMAGGMWSRREFRLPAGEDCAALERLVVTNAAVEAHADFARGATHLVGVHGYTLELPAVPRDGGDRIPSNYRVEVLPCTSDGTVSPRHGALNRKARGYAAAYNQATLSRLGAPRPEYARQEQGPVTTRAVRGSAFTGN